MGFINNVNVDVRGAAHIAPCTYKTVVLKQNVTKQNLNVLTQNMLDEYGKNTKFVIKWDYVLDENITVPANCVLEFDGGSIKDGTIIGNNTLLTGNVIIPLTLTLEGTFANDEFYFDWWHAPINENPSESAVSCSAYLQHAVDNIPSHCTLLIGGGNYYIDNTITITKESIVLKGIANSYFKKTFINYNPNVDITFFVIKNHNVIFDSIDIHGGYAEEGYDDNSRCTGIVIDYISSTKATDGIKIINSHIGFVNIGILNKTNNVTIRNSTVSTCRKGIVLSDDYVLYFNRNVYITDCFLHSCNKCIEIQNRESNSSPWRCINITGCDFNAPVISILEADKVQNMVFANNQNMQIAADTELVFVLNNCSSVNIINNTLVNLTTHIASVFDIPSNCENINIIGNIINGFKQRCINANFKGNISHNIIINCVGVGTTNIGEECSLRAAAEVSVFNNYFTNSSLSTGAAIQLSSKKANIGNNFFYNYTYPFVGANSNKVKTIFNNGKLEYLRSKYSALDVDCVGYFCFDNGKPIWWNGTKYIENDGAADGVKRSGTKAQRPSGADVYVGFQYMQVDTTNGTFPIWASVINDDTVTWVDATGATV